MIWGRPTNLWLGVVSSVIGMASILALTAGVDPTLVAQLAGSAGAVMGAIVALVAYRPPTLNPGDTFHVTTPEGQPNATTIVAEPPAADAPPVMHGDPQP